MRERLFLGDEFERERSRREDFDPIAEGKRHGLAPAASTAIWEHVRREATNRGGVCDETAARARFAQLADLVARRGGRLGPEPFHWTQVDAAAGRVPPHELLAARVPGKTTLVLAETSARARVPLNGVPGRTTLVASHTAPEVVSLEESHGFFQRYVNGGHAARAKLERAIAARDQHAAVVAVFALKQDLASAHRHLANGLDGDEGLRAELAALERLAEPLLAKLPNMSAGGQPWELWGPNSAEWRAAIGDDPAQEGSAAEAPPSTGEATVHHDAGIEAKRINPVSSRDERLRAEVLTRDTMNAQGEGGRDGELPVVREGAVKEHSPSPKTAGPASVKPAGPVPRSLAGPSAPAQLLSGERSVQLRLEGVDGRQSVRSGRAEASIAEPSAEAREHIGSAPANASAAPRHEPSAQVRGLPWSLRSRMERAYDRRFVDVELHRDSAEVSAGQRAVTRGRHIHLERGVEPASPHGEQILAHELAHVAQQDSPGARIAGRPELEREAARAATLALQGQAARVALRAEASTAYAFSEDDEHDADEREPAAIGDAAVSDESTLPRGTHGPDSATHDQQASTSPSETAEHHDARADQSGIDAVSAVVQMEEAPSSAPPRAGGPAAKSHKEPPNIAQAKPEHGLHELRGVRPDKLAAALGTVHSAASADVAQARVAQHANPPKRSSTGAAFPGAKGQSTGPATTPATAALGGAPKPGSAKDAASKAPAPTDTLPATAPATTTAKQTVDRPVKGEVPGGESEKQAKQGAATEQQKLAGQVVMHVASSIAASFGAWSASFGRQDAVSVPGAQSAQPAKTSDDESRRMADSVDQIPTATTGVSTDTGPASELAMKGEARTSADRQRAAFEQKAAMAEAQGRADSRAPLGEDHIDATAPPEELTAMSLVSGAPAATPSAAIPSMASAPSEEVGVVAQEQHGAEVDAALTKATADATAERTKHAAEETRVRAESDAQLRELKTKADADQAAERDAAQAEADAARAQWQAEIDKQGADARKQADKKVAEGMAQVEAEEAKGNAEAKRHIEEGKRKADEEKQKGQKEAADAKDKAKHKSSGFWGWVSSKAKAAFDGVKKAVSSAIDACRRAVKAVIEGAKKLAMAAIDLARKAINAAIQAVGQALLAISDVVLAAFPGLKARFQGLIRKAVDKATSLVNKIADRLKQTVQRALDLLGAALDRALQLLEKGLSAIIDAANAVVQGAIKAAQAVVEALGTWAKLLKEVASGPGAWLGKLGAAVVDGIKNHLWSAFKTTVVEWFKSKVFELLGVGGIILELLLEGGLTREHITQMAMDALMVAIPAALVAILIEKLVAMIVPAAGALMTIIEGLQAAWGTVSRIIAAFSAFIGFLLAVKSGSAGPLFAGLLAAAAVVVLDFVANWLLKKLASAARKVGSKLKGLAEKFKAKRKAKKDAKAGKHHDEHGAKAPNKHDHDGDPDKKPGKDKEETAAQKQARLDAAVVDVKGLMAKGQRLSLLLRARLALIRRRHKLDKLDAKKKGSANAWEVFAKVNPEAHFDLFSIEDDAADLRRAVGTRLASLPATATIAEVRQLCAQAAAAHMTPGYKLDWQSLRDSWVLFLERPGHKIPRTAVGEFRKTTHYKEISKHGDQTLYQGDGQHEYVHDSAGQYVPRILTRNISEEDRKALRKKRSISPTGPKTKLEIWKHVKGDKPSPYTSSSKVEDGGITNPHGEDLGGEHGRVRIDLLQISPKKIFDLTTKKGQDRWELSHPTTPAMRQVIEDVIRTQEVLIKGEIPYDAIEEL